MNMFERILKIFKTRYICCHCLGRMFSLLASDTTNHERGRAILLVLTMENHRKYLLGNDQEKSQAIENLKILAENAHFLPAQKVLEREGISYFKKDQEENCYLCNNIFSNLQKYIEKAVEAVKGIEFNNFLVGTSLDSEIENREDEFKSEFNILEAEAFKSHFNREIGKQLSKLLEVPTKFDGADILIIYHLYTETFHVEVKIRSLFIYGRYQKLIRGIPQTKWICLNCEGQGCEECNYLGKRYPTSVEELISPLFIKESKATNSSFHGAGREDIDVKMLGEGRPFILELKNPRIRNLDLKKIQERTNELNIGKIIIKDLRYSDKSEVIKIKEKQKDTAKVYKALVEIDKEISKEEFEELRKKIKETLEGKEIKQRTPLRVSHRRADKVRIKRIHNIKGKYLNPTTFEFIIETQGGTYIKELINGDGGRTHPSFHEIFKVSLKCKELDVIEIKS